MLTEKENKMSRSIADMVMSKLDMKPFSDLTMKVNDKLNKNIDLTFKTSNELLRYWNKTDQDWDFRIGYFDKNSQVRLNKKGDAIVITYLEIWTDDGGIAHENYRSAVVDNEHQALFQTRKRVE